jgi:hypothetical protein
MILHDDDDLSSPALSPSPRRVEKFGKKKNERRKKEKYMWRVRDKQMR